MVVPLVAGREQACQDIFVDFLESFDETLEALGDKVGRRARVLQSLVQVVDVEFKPQYVVRSGGAGQIRINHQPAALCEGWNPDCDARARLRRGTELFDDPHGRVRGVWVLVAPKHEGMQQLANGLTLTERLGLEPGLVLQQRQAARQFRVQSALRRPSKKMCTKIPIFSLVRPHCSLKEKTNNTIGTIRAHHEQAVQRLSRG